MDDPPKVRKAGPRLVGRPRAPRRRPAPPAVAAAAVIVAAAAGAARAAEEPRPGAWSLTAGSYLWAAGLEGDATVGGVEAKVDVDFDDFLDILADSDLALGAMLFAEARMGRFGFGLNGYFFRIEADARAGQELDIDATSDSGSVDATGFYRIAEWRLGETAGGGPVTLAVEPLAGARLTYMRTELDADLDLPGDSVGRQVDESETWVDPIVGARAILSLSHRWSLRLEGDVGGFGVGSDITWNAQGVVGYHFQLGRFDAALAAGYRALHWDYDDGDFAWDVTMQGPILGTTIRF